MKGKIRVVLVDARDESRRELQGLLGGLNSVWLAGTCESYAEAAATVSANAPDLTIVVLDADREQAVGLIQALFRDHPEMAVLPASKPCNSELILRVMRAGAREFLLLPTEPDDLLAAIDRLVRPAATPGPIAGRLGARVIAVAGAAGGIGCTTLAVNLAATLAKDPGQSVVLADFDLLLGSVDACLDLVPDRNVTDLAQNVERLDLTLLKRSLTRHSSGLHVLPRPATLEDAIRVEPESLRRVVGLLKAAFSTVVIDLSKGLQGTDLLALELADTIVMVVQLDVVCLRNTARLLHQFRQDEGVIDRVRLVANRVGSRECEISPRKAEETLGLPIAWQVPDAPREFTAARSRGVTLETQAPGCRAQRVLLELARDLVSDADAKAAVGKPKVGRFAAMFF